MNHEEVVPLATWHGANYLTRRRPDHIADDARSFDRFLDRASLAASVLLGVGAVAGHLIDGAAPLGLLCSGLLATTSMRAARPFFQPDRDRPEPSPLALNLHPDAIEMPDSDRTEVPEAVHAAAFRLLDDGTSKREVSRQLREASSRARERAGD